MNSFNHKVNGSVALVLGEIITGVVVLFIGVFMLATIEPMFGDLQECGTYTNNTGTPQRLFNAGLAHSKNISFTPTAVAREACSVHIMVTNNSATTGTYLVCRDGKSPTTLLENISVPITNVWTTIASISGETGVARVINITATGGNNVTVNSTSYITCCSQATQKSGPAGQFFNQTATTAGISFTVFGLVLIVIGLATAIGSLKNMF